MFVLCICYFNLYKQEIYIYRSIFLCSRFSKYCIKTKWQMVNVNNSSQKILFVMLCMIFGSVFGYEKHEMS